MAGKGDSRKKLKKRAAASAKPAKHSAMVPSFAFAGRMGSGKTTYADALRKAVEEEFNVKLHSLSLSTKMREIAKDLFGVEDKQRKLIQEIATKMRDIDKYIWAKYLIREIKGMSLVPFVVDNIRTQEEAEIFKSSFSNLVIIRIETRDSDRMGAYKREYGKYPTEDEAHDVTESSIEWIKEDITLHNNYSMDSMRTQISEVVKRIGSGSIGGVRNL
ncbi:MAG: hypothetical protein ACREBH_00440 [Candidatus Micrarchaeaceae archaeon]